MSDLHRADPYPIAISPETFTYPVQKVGSRAARSLEQLERSAGRNGELWMIHRAVFDARMAALQLMVQEGMQPLGEDDVRVVVEVTARCVSDEAGDIGSIPDGMTAVTVARQVRPW